MPDQQGRIRVNSTMAGTDPVVSTQSQQLGQGEEVHLRKASTSDHLLAVQALDRRGLCTNDRPISILVGEDLQDLSRTSTPLSDDTIAL